LGKSTKRDRKNVWQIQCVINSGTFWGLVKPRLFIFKEFAAKAENLSSQFLVNEGQGLPAV